MNALNSIKVADYWDYSPTGDLSAGLWEAMEEDFCNLAAWDERALKIEILNALGGYQHDSMSDKTFDAIQANKEVLRPIFSNL